MSQQTHNSRRKATRQAIAISMARRVDRDLEKTEEDLQQLADLPDDTKIPRNLKRNDKCPCGSGKKVKKCHSALLRGLKLQSQKRIAEGVQRGLKASIRGNR